MKIKKLTSSILLILMTILLPISEVMAISEQTLRIKDITHVKGIRENQVVGYGIVTGLASTGDNSRSTQITNQNLLNSLGTTIENFNDIKVGDVLEAYIMEEIKR